MTRNRSYTSATSDSNRRLGPALLALLVGAIGIAGLVLRAQRLAWQPLWWDEGYSIYFATEPLSRMTWLTARDIHPPTYYALLHGWFALANTSTDVTARWLSVLFGVLALPIMAWVARLFFPSRVRIVWLSVFLLAFNPFHLYYSQEVRMYGLALLLNLIATGFFVMLVERTDSLKLWSWPLLGYVVFGALALLTLYYSAFLLIAHQVWALVAWRRTKRTPYAAWLAGVLVLALQLPWWGYALPKLVPYVQDKVVSDQDQPLALWSYLWRHAVAMTAGHVPWPGDWQAWQVMAPLVVIPPVGAAFVATRSRLSSGSTALAILVTVPLLLGFIVNLLYPFFPDGGERLMLIVLPYALLLCSRGIDRVADESWWLGILAGLLLLVPAAVGCYVFFTTPRYVDGDYRPIVRFVTQHGRRHDTVVALFPWQVGYWRAYSPRTEIGGYLSPQPASIDQQALIWNPQLRADLDAALHRGTVWFPAPLSFGSQLPSQIETYLQTTARNMVNRWFSPTTRLTAWVGEAEPLAQSTDVEADFGDITLVRAGVSPLLVAGDNTPVLVDLVWQGDRTGRRASLRLLDDAGVQWAQRDLPTLGLAPTGAPTVADDAPAQVAFAIPVGLPPGRYNLFIGVGPEDSERFDHPVGLPLDASPLVPLAAIDVTTPEQPPSVYRLPVEGLLAPPPELAGVTMLGYAGLPRTPQLAGTDIGFRLFFAKNAPGPAAEIYASLVDGADQGMAGIQTWPMPDYPPNAWPADSLVQVPVTLPLPPDVPEGTYRLIVGLAADEDVRTAPVTLGDVTIARRPVTLSPPLLEETVDPPVLFGSHARLVGYSTSLAGDQLHVSLTWQIDQTLRPPHHIFVHLDDAAGERIAQADDPPQTQNGPAPSGSWLPGEYVTTRHTLTVPVEPQRLDNAILRVGLYNPATLVRLPASVNGDVQGDDAVLPVALP